MRLRLAACLLASGIAGSCIAADAAPASSDGLAIAKQGYLFAGGKYATVNGKRVMAGQIYAEFQIPEEPDAPLSHRDGAWRDPDRHQFHRHAGRAHGLGGIFPAPGLCGLRHRPAGARARGLRCGQRRAAGLPRSRRHRAALHRARAFQSLAAGAFARNGRERASRAIRCSTSSTPRKCPSCARRRRRKR